MLNSNSQQTVFIIQLMDSDSIEQFFDALSHESIYHFIPAPPPETMNEFVKRHLPNENKLVFGAFMDEAKKTPIGLLEIGINEERTATIGFILNNMYWGRGFASLMIANTIKEIQTKFDIHEIFAVVDSRNVGSIIALKKNCFTQIETRQSMLKREATIDFVLGRKIIEKIK